MTSLSLQLVKKVVQSGDTACLQPTLNVFRHEDQQLLRGHCHARALAILRARPGGAEGEAHTREAIAYLSLAIFASGRSLLLAHRAPILCQGHGEPPPCCGWRSMGPSAPSVGGISSARAPGVSTERTGRGLLTEGVWPRPWRSGQPAKGRKRSGAAGA